MKRREKGGEEGVGGYGGGCGGGSGGRCGGRYGDMGRRDESGRQRRMYREVCVGGWYTETRKIVLLTW